MANLVSYLFLLDTPHAEFYHPFPACTFVGGSFADPEERVGSDLVEAPARPIAGRIAAELHDVVALGRADHRQIGLPDRVSPLDAPGAGVRVIDPQRGAVAIAVRGGLTLASSTRRHDPDVLDRAALQHPAKMPFAGASARGPV